MAVNRKDKIAIGSKPEVIDKNSSLFGHSLLVILVGKLVDLFDETANDYVTLTYDEFISIT